MADLDIRPYGESSQLDVVETGQLSPKESMTSRIKSVLPKVGELGGSPVRGAISLGEAGLSMLTGTPAFVTGSVGKVLAGGEAALEGRVPTQQDYERGAERATPQTFKDWTYDPATEGGKKAAEYVGDAASMVGKSFAVPQSAAYAAIEGIIKGKSLPEIKKIYDENFERLSPTTLAAFEAVLAGSMGAPRRGKPKAQEVPVEQPKNFKTQTELAIVEEGSLAPPKPRIGAEEAGAGMSVAENQSGFRGSNRGGGILPPEEIARIEKEIMTEVTKPDVQGDLFRPWRDEAAMEVKDSGVGSRDRPDSGAGYGRGLQEMGTHTERLGPQDSATLPRPGPKDVQLNMNHIITREELNDVVGMGKVGDIVTAARKERNERLAQTKLREEPIEPSEALRKKWESVPKGQRGGLYFSENVKPGEHAPYKKVFEWLKSQWPRFSEVKDIIVLGEKEWADATKRHEIDAKDTQAFMSMKDGVIFIPEGHTNPRELAKTMAHELRHGFDHGRKPFSKDPGYWTPDLFPRSPWNTGSNYKGGKSEGLAYLSIPAEKKAFKAEDAAEKRFNETALPKYEVIDYTTGKVVGGPYQSRSNALKGVDRLDNAFGGYKHKVREIADSPPQMPRGPGKSQGGWIGTFEKDADKKGLVGTLMDFKKQFNVEKRPLHKVLADEGINPKVLKDIASDDAGLVGRLDRLWEKGMSNFEIDKTMSILAASKGPIGHIVKWAVDMRRQVTRDKDIRVREREMAMMQPWLKLSKESPKELMEMKEKWIDNIGGSELRREDFTTERQWKTYDAIQTVIKEGWEAVNAARKGASLKPIAYINNYFPAIREGNYWVRVVDSAGETKWAGAAKTIYGAQKIYDTIRKDFDGQEGMKVEKPFLRKKGQYDLADLSAFEETIRVLDRNDPVTRAIQDRYAKLAASRGIGRTGLHRRGIPGALGFEKGDIGVRNVEKVLEHYIRRQEAYVANLKIGKLREEFGKLPKELRDKMPLAENWINEYFNHALGADLSKESTIRGIVEALSETAGISREAPRTFIQELSGVASLLWLTNAKFIISQTVQPLLALPKILQMQGIDPTVTNPIKAFYDGQSRWFTRDATTKGIVDWASKNGYLDSSISALLDLKATDVRGQRWGAVGAAARLPMAKLEKEIVRGPVLLMFDSALEHSIKDPKERWQVAAEMMDYYMTHYDRESSPLMYNKMGLLGDMARPLKQYSHNNFGQFFEYAQDIKDRKTIAPMASYMGLQALVGGLKGVILVAEATAIITALNALFGTEIPTPQEAMFKYGIPDILVFGGLSTMLGVDVSSSVAAPGMPNMFSLAGPEFGYEALASVWPYLIKKAKGQESDADAMRALLAVTPKAMHGWIEEAYTQPGGPVPNPRAEMQGKYRRQTDFEKNAAMASLRSIPEAKANETVRITKELLKRDLAQKIDTLDAIASRVANKQPIEPQLIQRYVKEGGNPADLPKNIKDRLMGRALTWEEQQMKGKQMTPQQMHKLERMKEFMDKNQDTLTRPESREESNFKKMAQGHNEPKNLKYADDGREASLKKRHEEDVHRERQTDTTERRQLMYQARRLFPGDVRKQMKWAEATSMRLEQERVAPPSFGRGNIGEIKL